MVFIAEKEELSVILESYLPWINFTLLKTQQMLYESSDVKVDYIELFRTLADKLPEASLPKGVNLGSYFFETAFDSHLMPIELYSELQEHIRTLFLES